MAPFTLCPLNTCSPAQKRDYKADQNEALDGATFAVVINVSIVVVIIFGTLGNIINLSIWSKQRMRVPNFTLFIIALSITDIVLLLVRLPAYLYDILANLKHAQPIHNCDITWQVYYWYSYLIVDTCLASSVWIKAAVTVVRYLSICYPVHAKTIISQAKSRVALIAIILTSITINVPAVFLMFTPISGYIVVQLEATDAYNHIVYWNIRNVFDVYIPAILMTFCVLKLCRKLAKNNKVVNLIFAGREVQEQRRTDQNMLSFTLISNVIIFVVLLFPRVLADCMSLFGSENEILRAVAFPVMYLHFGLNVVMNSISNRRFRSHLQELLTCTYNGSQAEQSETRDPSRDPGTSNGDHAVKKAGERPSHCTSV